MQQIGHDDGNNLIHARPEQQILFNSSLNIFVDHMIQIKF